MSTTSTDTERPSPPPHRNRGATLPMVVMACVVVAAFAALMVSLVRGDEAEATTFDTADATVEGNSLAAPGDRADPAVGQQAPVIEGRDLAGKQLTVPAVGKPTLLLFVAHWCPHCRREIPKVQDYVDSGQVPEGAELVAVATSMDPGRPNYPASEWLDREGWTSPALADAGKTAADAYGLPAFPYWVAVDAEGRVVQRATGELTDAQIDGMLAVATAGLADPETETEAPPDK
jgi:thiol-disulfide isomerase/thioredoxin